MNIGPMLPDTLRQAWRDYGRTPPGVLVVLRGQRADLLWSIEGRRVCAFKRAGAWRSQYSQGHGRGKVTDESKPLRTLAELQVLVDGLVSQPTVALRSSPSATSAATRRNTALTSPRARLGVAPTVAATAA